MARPRYYMKHFGRNPLGGWGVACTVDCSGGTAGSRLVPHLTRTGAALEAARLNRLWRWWNNVDHPTWTDPEVVR